MRARRGHAHGRGGERALGGKLTESWGAHAVGVSCAAQTESAQSGTGSAARVSGFSCPASKLILTYQRPGCAGALFLPMTER
eukprot:5668171-Pleurochrysis_carterae.AAC.1